MRGESRRPKEIAQKHGDSKKRCNEKNSWIRRLIFKTAGQVCSSGCRGSSRGYLAFHFAYEGTLLLYQQDSDTEPQYGLLTILKTSLCVILIIITVSFFQDASWRNLAVMEEGFHNLYGDHVQLYVLKRENFADFLTYMKTHHRYEIIKQDYLLKRAVFEENGCQKQ